MLQNEIKVKISYNDKDIKKSIIYIINNVKKSWHIFPIFIIIIIGILFYGVNNGFENIHYILVTICIAFLMLFYITLYKRPINSYINFYRKKQEGTYIFSEEGICLEEDQKSYDWSLFVQAYDIPVAFILADAKLNYYIFPKKCFNNLSDIEQLKNLLSEKRKI